MRPRVAIFPGSFDPLHFGHTHVLFMAQQIFDTTIVVVSENPDKKYLLTSMQRVDILRQYAEEFNFPNRGVIRVERSPALIVDLATAYDANFLVRGVRNSEDLEYEQAMAETNRILSRGFLQTIFVPCLQEGRHISSKLVRSLVERPDTPTELRKMVPEHVLRQLNPGVFNAN